MIISIMVTISNFGFFFILASEKKNRTIENIISVSNIQNPLAEGPKDSGFVRLPIIPENEIDIF